MFGLTRTIHVPVVKALAKPLGLLSFSLAISFVGYEMHVSPWIVAPLAAIVPTFVLAERAWAGRSTIPAAFRELRGRDRAPATSGAS